jgi:hypothetical protein
MCQARAVAILIDEARWWYRGRKWCHLVSDLSLEELHAFADANQIPRRGFQGDHYDIPEEFRAQLIDAGATVVESRELLRRLRGAGLRLTPSERRRRASEAVHQPGRAGS